MKKQKCPRCNSTRTTFVVVRENGKLIKKFHCKKCDYVNHRYLER